MDLENLSETNRFLWILVLLIYYTDGVIKSLIFRACLDAVIPKRRHIRVQHEDLGDPINLLCLALRYIPLSR